MIPTMGAGEKIAVVQAFGPAESGKPNRLRQATPTRMPRWGSRQGYGSPPKRAKAEGSHSIRSDF